VRATNFLGSAASRDALLTVLPAPVAIGSWTQAVDNVTLGNGLAWLARGEAGVSVLNVTDPASPSLLGNYDTPGLAVAVRLAGNLACVADRFGGLKILSVANPASPVLLGTYATPDWAQDVAVVGNTAYIAASGAGLQIVDLSKPAQPLLLGSFVILPLVGYQVARQGVRPVQQMTNTARHISSTRAREGFTPRPCSSVAAVRSARRAPSTSPRARRAPTTNSCERSDHGSTSRPRPPSA